MNSFIFVFFFLQVQGISFFRGKHYKVWSSTSLLLLSGIYCKGPMFITSFHSLLFLRFKLQAFCHLQGAICSLLKILFFDKRIKRHFLSSSLLQHFWLLGPLITLFNCASAFLWIIHQKPYIFFVCLVNLLNLRLIISPRLLMTLDTSMLILISIDFPGWEAC